jgi:hypothetical protein
VKTWGYPANHFQRSKTGLDARSHILVLGALLLFSGMTSWAGPAVSLESPIGFFTNVASRLLRTQSTLSLNRIQIYPTNQYTPSIHRLLQLTANLYDAMTNRADLSAYPYLPTVFRPIFLDTTVDGQRQVFITGYAEVTTNDLPALTSGLPVPHDLSDPNDQQVRSFDLVYGIPLIVGAKKGLPNFNKFEMQTLVQVTRKLQFRRPAGSTTLPVSQTNQMFLLAITNSFGVEAWNSYAPNWNAYAPGRNLRLVVLPDLRVVVSNRVPSLNLVNSNYRVSMTTPMTDDWPGYDPSMPSDPSFQIPLSTNFSFVPAATYLDQGHMLVPITGTFELNPPDGTFYIPQWSVCVKTRLRFAIVDDAANRLLDYVNLSSEATLDLTDALSSGGQCGDLYTPNGNYGSLWCASRSPSPNDVNLPTFGILNQIQASLGWQPVINQVDWNSALIEFPPGMDKNAAIDFFRFQFGLAPLYSHPPGTYFYRSNTFAAPYQPFRNIFLFNSWEANDPLVHYTVANLLDLVRTNIQFDHLVPVPTAGLGRRSVRYQPWGFAPGNPKAPGPYEPAVKDPLVTSSDGWDFPANAASGLSWLGQVHRGTPWQTLYLKSGAANLGTWQNWSGNGLTLTNFGQIPTNIVPLYVPGTMIGRCPDAFFTQPTNDWRLASLLVSLLSTNDPHNLFSANQPNSVGWCGVLDGIVALTNAPPDDQSSEYSQLLPILMQSNSPQAAMIAAAIDGKRLTQANQHFQSPGDVLATPELSTASPWLNLSLDQQQRGISDEAYEAIPSQLLPLLRVDSIAAIGQTGATVEVQFSGFDGYAYGVAVSSNLADWVFVSTNYPTNGSFSFVEAALPGASRRFYRSVLLP